LVLIIGSPFKELDGEKYQILSFLSTVGKDNKTEPFERLGFKLSEKTAGFSRRVRLTASPLC
jgi:hypothetical protein